MTPNQLHTYLKLYSLAGPVLESLKDPTADAFIWKCQRKAVAMLVDLGTEITVANGALSFAGYVCKLLARSLPSRGGKYLLGLSGCPTAVGELRVVRSCRVLRPGPPPEPIWSNRFRPGFPWTQRRCPARFGRVCNENTRAAARLRDPALDCCCETALTAGRAIQGQLTLWMGGLLVCTSAEGALLSGYTRGPNSNLD